MIVAVNTKFLSQSTKEGYGNFIYECFSRITNQYPQHTFIFIFDRPYNPAFIFSSNIIPAVVSPPIKNLVLLKFWYNYKVSATLRKYKADLFITADVFCSLLTKVPQLLIIHDLMFLHSTRLVKKKYLKYYKKNIAKFLEKAAIITALSNFCKNSIIENYEIDPGKIEVVNSGVDEAFEPIDLNSKEKIKEQYAKGSEYFLFYGSPQHGENLFLILKAFSVFKKWQKSSMQLLIVRSHDLKPKELQSIRLFKYYEDVRILQPPSHDLKQITAAAYAVIDFSYNKSFGIHSLEAMKCNVPIIADNESVMSEVCDDAALYINNEYKVLAEKMMMIYKDETLRNRLIEKGKKQVEKFSWAKTAGLFWQSILKACS